MTYQDTYPIGIQSFEKLINGGFTYVDKTAFVADLVKKERCYLLSRPRRFGKSLLLSTLHAYFDCKRELFKGLVLDKADVDWTPTPVFHFDLNAEAYVDPDALSIILNRILKQYESQYGIDNSVDPDSISGRFARLIRTAVQQTGRKVAILVDEYDKPLLGLSEDSDQFKKNQGLLKGFFGNLKSMDEFIRFAILTGVARFSKVSIFSDLNNLDDISLNEDFADICGWTEEELIGNFRPGIEALAEKFEEDFDATLNALREYYDGYLFDENGHRLYNPFSVLKALKSRKIEPYWFETGTPTFLANLVKENGISLPNLNEELIDRQSLMSIGLTPDNLIPLMFQTGYLTIDSCYPGGTYKLRFPNREVEVGFAKQLYPLYVPEATKAFSFVKFRNDLYTGNPEGFMTRLQVMLKEMPYELQNERNYQSILWLLCTICGTETIAERHSHMGRSDLEVATPNFVYVFEFKLNQSVETAMAQLRDRDYPGIYALDKRHVYLIGANFSTKKSDAGLSAWEIETLK